MADILQTAGLFVHVSSFTKYLLDEVLTADLQKLQDIPADKLKQCIKACDTLQTSIQNFKEKTSVINKNEKELKSKTSDDQLAPNLRELCEFLCKKSEFFNPSIKPYYCKFCGYGTFSQYEFNNHFISKKHLEKTNKLPIPPLSYKCKICHMLLIAPESEIPAIISIAAHCQLDEHIKGLGAKKDDQMQNTEDTVKLNKSNTNINYTFKNKVSIPEKIITVFNKQIVIKEPHYCHMCDVIAGSHKGFVEHCSSKKHIASVNAVTVTTQVYKCVKCEILILANQEVLDEIIYSESHQTFDEYVMGLKKSSGTGVTVPERKILEQVSTLEFTKPIVNKFSLQLKKLTEKLKVPIDFKKNFLSCCVSCSKVFISLNDINIHLISKKHNAAISVAEQCLHCCSVCQLLVCGTHTDITKLIELPEHIALDKKIQQLTNKNNDEAGVKDVPLDVLVDSPVPMSVDSNSVKELKITDISLTETAQSLADLDINKEPKNNKSTGLAAIESNKTHETIMKMISYHENDKSQSVTPLSHQDVSTVPEKFLILNCKLQVGNSTKYGFCRPCKKEVNTGNWTIHFSTNRHLKAKEKWASEDTIERCSFCPLEIVGDQASNNLCLDLHMKSNHNKDLKTVVPNRNSSTNNEGTLMINSETDKSNSPDLNTSGQSLICDFFTPSTKSHSFGESLETKKENKSSMLLDENVNILEMFVCFLKKRKELFLDEGIKKFGAVCLICKIVFEDYLEWLMHIREHRLNNQEIDVIEKSCRTCNFSLYGFDKLVNDELLNHEEHRSLDELISQQ